MTDETKDDSKNNNIKELSFQKDEFQANMEKFRREMIQAVEMTKEVAKFKFAQYQAFVDAGFTPAQALDLLKADMK